MDGCVNPFSAKMLPDREADQDSESYDEIGQPEEKAFKCESESHVNHYCNWHCTILGIKLSSCWTHRIMHVLTVWFLVSFVLQSWWYFVLFSGVFAEAAVIKERDVQSSSSLEYDDVDKAPEAQPLTPQGSKGNQKVADQSDGKFWTILFYLLILHFATKRPAEF